MLTDQQIADRHDKLGASDLPIVCGVSPYSSPIELYYKMTGDLERYRTEQTDQQMWGSLLEPVIAGVAATRLGLKIRRSPARENHDYPFLVAHLDFEIIGHDRGPGVLEIKRREGASFDELPDDIAVQVAGQLAATKREWGIVAVLFSWGKLATFEVKRDLGLERDIMAIAAEFMRCVHEKKPPATEYDRKSIEVLKKLYPRDSGQEIILPESLSPSIEKFLAAKSRLEEIENEKAKYEGEIKQAMGNASMASCGERRITWRATKDSTTLDDEALKIKYPKIWWECQVVKPGHRRFLVKKIKP